MEAIREGLQLYGVKSGTLWDDPLTWIEETYPWNIPSGCASTNIGSSSPNRSCPPLTRIRMEDVGFDKVNMRGTLPVDLG